MLLLGKVAVRGSKLKIKGRWRGVGGRAQHLPPDDWVSWHKVSRHVVVSFFPFQSSLTCSSSSSCFFPFFVVLCWSFWECGVRGGNIKHKNRKKLEIN